MSVPLFSFAWYMYNFMCTFHRTIIQTLPFLFLDLLTFSFFSFLPFLPPTTLLLHPIASLHSLASPPPSFLLYPPFASLHPLGACVRRRWAFRSRCTWRIKTTRGTWRMERAPSRISTVIETTAFPLPLPPPRTGETLYVPLWDKTWSFGDIESFFFPRVGEFVIEWAVRANERIKKRVAQYLYLDSWLFWTTMRSSFRRPSTIGHILTYWFFSLYF